MATLALAIQFEVESEADRITLVITRLESLGAVSGVALSEPKSCPPADTTGFAPNETAAPAGYPTASDDESEKPSPTASVAMSPS